MVYSVPVDSNRLQKPQNGLDEGENINGLHKTGAAKGAVAEGCTGKNGSECRDID
jgi:hypothetical protein